MPPDHLPYGAAEGEYLEDAIERYQQIADAATDLGLSPDSSGFTGTAVSWLETRQRTANLTPSNSTEWFDEYIERSYEAGRRYARTDLSTSGHSPPDVDPSRSAIHQQAKTTTFSRQRASWRRLGGDLREDVRDSLRSNLSSADEVSKTISDRVEAVGVNRARKISRTEPAWAFNRAFLAEVQEAGVEQVGVDTSWETVGDQRVCAECAARSGTYRVKRAVQMMEGNSFPPHPECRCHFAVS